MASKASAPSPKKAPADTKATPPQRGDSESSVYNWRSRNNLKRGRGDR
jgi:hypothetical protein